MIENGNKVKARHIRLSFVILTILFVGTLTGFAWLLNDVRNLSHNTAYLTKKTSSLTLENQRRINDIQDSRVESCKRTYSGVRDVLYPFFPNKKNRTRQEQAAIIKLNRTIIILQHGCLRQTKPEGGG